MNIARQILFLISALGACNGILLSGFLFFNKKSRSPAIFFLALSLLALSIRVAKSVFIYFNPQLPKIYLQIGLSACFLIGPSLYYFLRAAAGSMLQVPAAWKWSLGIQTGILLLAGIIFPYQAFPHIWNNIYVYIIYAQWFVYLIASGWVVTREIKANTLAGKFRVMVFAGSCIVFLAYILGWAGTTHGLYIAGPVSFSFILYITLAANLYRNGPETVVAGKPAKKKIPDADAQAWMKKLETALQQNDLYKDPQLKLSDLAGKVNIPAHQLSQLLNDNFGKSFSSFINEYRINEACKRIAANGHLTLTLEAIGYEVGYNSKSTFYSAFRKITGTTPALYKEQVETSGAQP